MSSDESSDSEMPYDSSDEEVWEEEEVSRDDDSDGGPGFLDPTRRAPGLHVVDQGYNTQDSGDKEPPALLPPCSSTRCLHRGLQDPC